MTAVGEYIYDGNKLIAELKTDADDGDYKDRREFFYDGNDEVIGFTRRNGQDTYFYLKDAEGNIIGFTDGNGSVQGLYDYDAWGKVSHRFSLSWENPLTYRSYYYDDENMLFYLQSRYYNPQWGRFLNADLPEIAQQSKNEINGLNLFAYCCNNPVNNSDPTGKWLVSIGVYVEAAAVVGVYGGIAVYIDSKGNIVISYCAGVQFSTNVVANASLGVKLYMNSNDATKINGFEFNVSASYSLGVHISGDTGLNIGVHNNYIDVVGGGNVGVGYSLVPCPTINIKGGYTGIIYKTTFKKVFSWKSNKSKKKSKKGLKV